MTQSEMSETGRATALVVYVLYLLSIPSFGAFALIGVILAYVGRAEAMGLARTHIEDQIRIWWIAFWWWLVLGLLSIVGWLLTPLLIGFPVLWLIWAAGFVVMVWFTIKSLLGMIALLDGRARG